MRGLLVAYYAAWRRLGTSQIRFHDSHDSLVVRVSPPCKNHYYELLASSLRHYAIYILGSRLFVAEHFYRYCRPSKTFHVPLDAICFPHKICVSFVSISQGRLLVAREIENKAFAKVCWQKKLYYEKIESRTDWCTPWAWSSCGEWRSSWITAELSEWVGYETFLGLTNHNSFRFFSWHFSSEFALVLAFYFIITLGKKVLKIGHKMCPKSV